MNPDFEQEYARYLAGEMSEAERKDFEQRVVDDPELSAEVYADLNLAAKLESDRVVRVPHRWWRWAAPLAAAAVILFAVNLMGPDLEEAGPVMRGGDTIEVVAPVGNVDAAPSRFEWRPVPGASRYRFELLDDNASVLQRQVVTDVQLTLEDAPTRGVWRVVALDELGGELMSSGPTQFEVVD